MGQSLANVLVHAIWSTKDRRPIIADDWRSELHAYMAGVLKKLESPALVINSVADHVHVLCQLSRNVALSKLVEEVKKSSTKWVKTQRASMFAWQNGYGVFSVSESNVPVIRNYIEGQADHQRPFRAQAVCVIQTPRALPWAVMSVRFQREPEPKC